MEAKEMRVGHPDRELKVGATREAEGLTWKLYINQYGYYWNAGALGGSIVIAGVKDHSSPYMLGQVGYASFEKAAAHAKRQQHKRYLDARTLVQNYEKAGGTELLMA